MRSEQRLLVSWCTGCSRVNSVMASLPLLTGYLLASDFRAVGRKIEQRNRWYARCPQDEHGSPCITRHTRQRSVRGSTSQCSSR